MPIVDVEAGVAKARMSYRTLSMTNAAQIMLRMLRMLRCLLCMLHFGVQKKSGCSVYLQRDIVTRLYISTKEGECNDRRVMI